MKKLTWSGDAAFQTTFDEASTVKKTSVDLTGPFTNISTIQITVSATNWLSSTPTVVTATVQIETLPVPTVSILGPSLIQVLTTDDLWLVSAANQSECAQTIAPIRYSWKFAEKGTVNFIPYDSILNNTALYISKGTLLPGKTYTVDLTVTQNGLNADASVEISVSGIVRYLTSPFTQSVFLNISFLFVLLPLVI